MISITSLPYSAREDIQNQTTLQENTKKTQEEIFHDFVIDFVDEDKKRNAGMETYAFNHPEQQEELLKQGSLSQEMLGNVQAREKKLQAEEERNSRVKNILPEGELEEIQKMNFFPALSKLFPYLIKYNRLHNNTYQEQRVNRTDVQKTTVEKIEKESGNKVQILVDPKFVELFRNIQGISYRGGALLGKRIVVDDPKSLEDEAFLRHEGIHCLQQREMGIAGKVGGFTSWTIQSLLSLLGKQYMSNVRGLDEAGDYGTDNQRTDYETYVNQFTPGYLATRKPFAHEKYKDPVFRIQEYKRIRELEEDEIDPELKEQYKRVCDILDKDEEVRVVLIKPDILNSEKEDGKRQVRTESQKNRDIRIPLEREFKKQENEEIKE